MIYQLTIDDYIGTWGYSKQYIRKELANYKGKHVDVKISSLGGELDHGLDIRQQFIDHGDVTVYLSGFVASAATVIAMGAKRIIMSKYAMFLVHKCSNYIDAWGSYNADQMQQLIDELTANKKENEKIDVVLANMYAAKCGKKVSEILSILKEGRWLTAEEALEYGFVDELTDIDSDTKLNFTPELRSKFNAIGITTAGLETSQASQASQAPQPKQQPKMKSYKFSAVDSLLKLDVGLTPDTEGYVSVDAAQMETINNHIDTLTADAKSHKEALDEAQAKITQLEEQIKNLKEAPGADTDEIEDGEDAPKLTSIDLYNSVKNCI